jgi:hypothetical protein
MVRAEPAREVPVLPRTIEMVVRIIAAGVMPDPFAVRMNVRGIWVSRLVAEIAVFRRSACPPANRSGAVSRRSA